MNIAICTPPEIADSLHLLLAALKNRGHALHILHHCSAIKTRQNYDVAFYRGSHRASDNGKQAGIQALERLVRQGVPPINSLEALHNGWNKEKSAACFYQHGIPHPPTTSIEAERCFRHPLIIKPIYGARGEGVTLVNSREEARVWQEELQEPCLLQEYIAGQTIRIITSRYKALAAYRKIAPQGTVVANVSQGARREWIAISAALEKAAKAALCALDGDLMGMDFIETNGEYIVLEGNSGFCLYPEDRWLHELIAVEIEQLVFLKKNPL